MTEPTEIKCEKCGYRLFEDIKTQEELEENPYYRGWSIGVIDIICNKCNHRNIND